MKRIGLILFMLFGICTTSHAVVVTEAYVTVDGVTVEKLEKNRVTLTNAFNVFDGSLIQAESITAAQHDTNSDPETRFDESFTDFIVSGLSTPTSASLTSVTTSGTAYINGARVAKDSTSKVYTASKHTYLDLSSNGTYTYQEVAIDAAEPSVTTDSVRLARVSTDATTVLSVRDDREVGIEPATGGYKVGSFTRDISLSNSDQAITGVGFRPSAILLMGGISGDDVLSFGFSDSLLGRSLADNNDGVAGTWQINYGDVTFTALSSAANEARITAVVFDVDGFTLTWINAEGNPTGTVTIHYVVFK